MENYLIRTFVNCLNNLIFLGRLNEESLEIQGMRIQFLVRNPWGRLLGHEGIESTVYC
jgi:hypothetical protein